MWRNSMDQLDYLLPSQSEFSWVRRPLYMLLVNVFSTLLLPSKHLSAVTDEASHIVKQESTSMPPPPKKKANYFITSDNVCLNHYSEAANYIKRKHMSTLAWQTALTSMWQAENSKSTYYLFIQKASQKCSLRPCSQINPLQTPTVQNLSPLIIYAVPGQAGSWSMWEECTTWLWSLGFIL